MDASETIVLSYQTLSGVEIRSFQTNKKFTFPNGYSSIEGVFEDVSVFYRRVKKLP